MRGLMGVLGLVTASLVFPTLAQATLDRPVGTEQPDHLDSGTLAKTAGIATQVFGGTVRVGGAAWLRLYFGRVEVRGGGGASWASRTTCRPRRPPWIRSRRRRGMTTPRNSLRYPFPALSRCLYKEVGVA